MLTVVLVHYYFHRAHTLTTIFFHQDWPQKETSIHLSLFSCWRCWAANSLLLFFFESHGPRARIIENTRLLSRSPVKHSNTRTRVSFSYFMRFLQDLFRCFFLIVTVRPCEKSPNGQTKYHIRCMKKEKDKEKEEKRRKRKERKRGKREKCTHRPLPNPTSFRLSPDFLWHPRSERWRQCMKKWIERFLDFRVQ